MKGHRFDPASFIFGVAFLAIAMVTSFANLHLGLRWFSWAGAGLLIAAGLALVAGSRSKARGQNR